MKTADASRLWSSLAFRLVALNPRAWASLSIVSLILCLAIRVDAATKVWTGAKDGRWSNPTNWAGGIIPRQLDSLEFPGELQGTGTFRKLGQGGTLVLSGNSPFSGNIDLIAGRLELTGSASNSLVTLAPATTLAGHGEIRSLVASGAVVRPSGGTLRVGEGFTLDSFSRLEVPLRSVVDPPVRAGTFNPGQAVLQLEYEENAGDGPFTLVAADEVAPGTAFAGLLEGQTLLLIYSGTPTEFRVSYAGDPGHHVVLTKIRVITPPSLRMRRSTPGEITIEWPLDPAGFYVEVTPQLDPATWHQPGSIHITTTTNNYCVDLANGDSRYYRLVRLPANLSR